jgi:hypothetical protein
MNKYSFYKPSFFSLIEVKFLKYTSGTLEVLFQVFNLILNKKDISLTRNKLLFHWISKSHSG